jgi:hypothetical protein
MLLEVIQETSTVGKHSFKSLMASLQIFVVCMNSVIVGVYLESNCLFRDAWNLETNFLSTYRFQQSHLLSVA